MNADDQDNLISLTAPSTIKGRNITLARPGRRRHLLNSWPTTSQPI